MTPKRSGEKVVGAAVRSARKVVKETVQVAVIERVTQGSTQDQELDTGETEDIDAPEKEILRTIPVEEKVQEDEDNVIEVSMDDDHHRPVKEAAAPIDGSQEQEEQPSREEERKEDQTSEVPPEEPSTDDLTSEGSHEEPSRKEDQISEVFQEEPMKDQEDISRKEAAKKEKITQEGKKTTGKMEQTQERKGKKKRKRLAPESGGHHGYKRYVFKVLKQVHPELGISSMAMSVIDSLMNDMFERIADEAAKLSHYRKSATVFLGKSKEQ